MLIINVQTVRRVNVCKWHLCDEQLVYSQAYQSAQWKLLYGVE